MNDFMDKLADFSLFKKIQETELPCVLHCLGSYVKTYPKGSYISLEAEKVKSIGLILEGTVHMIKEDDWGNTTLLVHMGVQQLFGETFVCGTDTRSAVTFCTSEETTVLFLPFERVMHSCSNSCAFHHQLIENMVTLIADKNKQLLEKLEVVSQKTLRKKILVYLSLQAKQQGKRYFEIPLGRLELADYLCSDRSALTRELARMKEDGLLDFEKKIFHLL